jgi:transcriptional regulator with GAF, ATPase, and Fis domain
MGTQLLACFEEAGRIGGLVAKMRLASMIQITSTEAGMADDEPTKVAKARRALEKLRAQFPSNSRPPDVAIGRVDQPKQEIADARLLRRHIATYLDLMAQRSLFLGDVGTTVRRVTEAASTSLAVERVSVWFCDARGTKISCADLFDRASSEHSSGVELSQADFGPYFEALRTESTIAAHDAHQDPRTRCFSASYLGPLGITSMLDVPIWVNKRMVGVVCHEHVGPMRRWNEDEEKFAYLMSHFVALALERGSGTSAEPRT